MVAAAYVAEFGDDGYGYDEETEDEREAIYLNVLADMEDQGVDESTPEAADEVAECLQTQACAFLSWDRVSSKANKIAKGPKGGAKGGKKGV